MLGKNRPWRRVGVRNMNGANFPIENFTPRSYSNPAKQPRRHVALALQSPAPACAARFLPGACRAPRQDSRPARASASNPDLFTTGADVLTSFCRSKIRRQRRDRCDAPDLPFFHAKSVSVSTTVLSSTTIERYSGAVLPDHVVDFPAVRVSLTWEVAVVADHVAGNFFHTARAASASARFDQRTFFRRPVKLFHSARKEICGSRDSGSRLARPVRHRQGKACRPARSCAARF